jgi:hypothetical protein
MAQYFTDFSSTADNTRPADTTLRRDASANWKKQTVTTDSVLQYVGDSGSPNAISFDSGESSGVTELYTQFSNIDNVSLRFALFASDSPDDEYAATLGTDGTSGPPVVAIQRRVNGSFSLVAVSSFSWVTGNYYNVRFQVSPGSPNQLKVKAWNAGAEEPATWSIETTDNGRVLSSGWSGALSFASSGVGNIKRLGIGTDGDTAPTAPVSSTTQVSVSSSATALSNFSAIVRISTSFSESATAIYNDEPIATSNESISESSTAEDFNSLVSNAVANMQAAASAGENWAELISTAASINESAEPTDSISYTTFDALVRQLRETSTTFSNFYSIVTQISEIIVSAEATSLFSSIVDVPKTISESAEAQDLTSYVARVNAILSESSEPREAFSCIIRASTEFYGTSEALDSFDYISYKNVCKTLTIKALVISLVVGNSSSLKIETPVTSKLRIE